MKKYLITAIIIGFSITGLSMAQSEILNYWCNPLKVVASGNRYNNYGFFYIQKTSGGLAIQCEGSTKPLKLNCAPNRVNITVDKAGGPVEPDELPAGYGMTAEDNAVVFRGHDTIFISEVSCP